MREKSDPSRLRENTNLQLIVEYYEDDRNPENYKFIIVKELVNGLQTLEKKVKDMTRMELACIINSYAKCLENLNMPFF